MPELNTFNHAASRRPRITVAVVIAAITLASFLYRWLVMHRLEQTSALFIGIPAFLAILVVLGTEPQSATGLLCKVMAVALLVSGIFLGEGFVCILMASPLFLLVAVIVGRIIDWSRKKKKGPSRTTTASLLILAFLPMSFEGATPAVSFGRDETVRRELLVPEGIAEVRERIGSTPRFDAPLPPFLRLRFPRPVAAAGSGLTVGSRRTIHFAGGEGRPGDLVLEVVSIDDHSVEFREVSDTSKLAHWLQWQTTRFEWSAQSDGTTRIICEVRYQRLLDPAWYFKPWERYAVGEAAEYLTRSLVEASR